MATATEVQFPPLDPHSPEELFAFGQDKQEQIRFANRHACQFMLSACVSRGLGSPSELPSAINPELSLLTVTDPEGATFTVDEALLESDTDGFIALHRGNVVMESYFHGAGPQDQQLVYSVAKGFLGLVTASLAEQGLLDLNAPIPDYLPELAGGAFDGVPLIDALLQRTGIQFRPDVDAPGLSRSKNMRTLPADYDGPHSGLAFIRDNLKEKAGPPGKSFYYAEPNVETTSWVVERVTGKRLPEVVSEMIWSKLGAERDAYYTIDRSGAAHVGSGFNCTLRDAARYGQMLLQRGAFNGQQVVPASVVEAIEGGAGNRQAFENAAPGSVYPTAVAGLPAVNYAYHITHLEIAGSLAFCGVGLRGNYVLWHPASQLVIACFSNCAMLPYKHQNELFTGVVEALAGYYLKGASE